VVELVGEHDDVLLTGLDLGARAGDHTTFARVSHDQNAGLSE
jgi:hypothetical protein